MKSSVRPSFSMLTYHDKEVFDMTTQELLQKAKASKAAMALADTDRKV